jgi:hypothetical protein
LHHQAVFFRVALGHPGKMLLQGSPGHGALHETHHRRSANNGPQGHRRRQHMLDLEESTGDTNSMQTTLSSGFADLEWLARFEEAQMRGAFLQGPPHPRAHGAVFCNMLLRLGPPRHLHRIAHLGSFSPLVSTVECSASTLFRTWGTLRPRCMFRAAKACCAAGCAGAQGRVSSE